MSFLNKKELSEFLSKLPEHTKIFLYVDGVTYKIEHAALDNSAEDDEPELVLWGEEL